MSRIPAVILCSALALPAVGLSKDHDDHGPPAKAHYAKGPPPHAPAYGYYRGWVPPPRPLPPPYYGYRRPPSPVYVYRPVPVPVYGYRPYPPPCYGYGCYRYKHDNDNDDAWWALGGLVPAVTIGTAIDRTYSAPPPPPPPR